MDGNKMKLTIYEKNAADWLCKAQDVMGEEGSVSKYYKIGEGWSKEGYQEVSGYIIPTFIRLYEKTGEKDYFNRAVKIADWLIKIQGKDGQWQYVFDTGQVLLGLTCLNHALKQATRCESHLSGEMMGIRS